MTSLLRWPARAQPLLLFGALAAAMVAVECAAVRHLAGHLPAALPPAVTFDLLVLLPGLFYWLVVRRYNLPLSTIAAVFGSGLALVHWLLPAEGLTLWAWASRLAQALEVLTLGYTAGRLRRIRRGYLAARQQSADFLDNLYAAGQPVLGKFNYFIMTEVAVLRYALLGAWAAPEVGPGQQAFSTYRTTGFGALLLTLGGLSVVELMAAHLVVAHWHPYLAWGLTAASGYSLLWLLAHGQAVRRRPVLVTSQTLVLRVGFCWRAAIELAHIADIKVLSGDLAPAPGLLNAARPLLAPPNVLLKLTEPQVVHGLFGVRRLVGRLAFYVDEPADLIRQLAAQRP